MVYSSENMVVFVTLRLTKAKKWLVEEYSTEYSKMAIYCLISTIRQFIWQSCNKDHFWACFYIHLWDVWFCGFSLPIFYQNKIL